MKSLISLLALALTLPAADQPAPCAAVPAVPVPAFQGLLAGALFAALKWQATQLYARAVVELVLWQMGA